MIGEPKLENRDAQHYMGIRTQVSVSEFSTAIPQLHGEVFGWLRNPGIAPAGAPFIRYHVINMEGKMDVEMGVLVSSTISGDDRVRAAILPAGQYASLIYTDVRNGIPRNAALLDWGAKKGLVWDTYESDQGDGFGARYESFLTDPKDEPDLAKWDTEVTIRLADKQPQSS